MQVIKMISYDEAEKMTESIGGLGGFFSTGMRWEDYLSHFDSKVYEYAEAIREYVVNNKIKRGGDWHQSLGTFLFDDNTVGSFSYRAWGDIMAAIWSEEEDKDYCYMDFYMDCCVKEK